MIRPKLPQPGDKGRRKRRAGPPSTRFECGLAGEDTAVLGLAGKEVAAILSSPVTSIRDRFRPAQQGELPTALESGAPTDGALEQAVEEARKEGYITGVLAMSATGRWLVAGENASPEAHKEAAAAAREKFGPNVRIFLRSL